MADPAATANAATVLSAAEGSQKQPSWQAGQPTWRTEQGRGPQAMAARGDEQTKVEVEGRRLTLSNLDKVLFPEPGTTKGDVIAYYTQIAPVILPHLRGRPVTLVRAPDGVDGGRFFEKNVPRGAPGWVHSIPVAAGEGARSRRRGSGQETIDYPAVGDLPSLVWVANLAAIELHTPMWRVDDQGRPLPPDLLVFDLDPGEGAGLTECAVVAGWLRTALEGEGMTAHPKTSGGKGLQLYTAWDAGRRGPDTLDYAHRLARSVETDHGELVLSNMRKDLRRAKVLIDWSQNNRSKTTVTPYSLRLRPVPTVSCPITWEEVEAVAGGADPEKLRFSPDAVLARVVERGDLFSELAGAQTRGPATSSTAATTTRRSRSRS